MRSLISLFTAALLAATIPTLPSTAEAAESRPLLSLEMARHMADACEEMRNATDWNPIIVAIVDRGADLVLFRRQDDALLGSVDIALGKARSAAKLSFSTRSLRDIVYGKDGKPGRAPGLIHFPDFVALPGGLPVLNAAGELVGGIGVSGATGDQDEMCAQAAIDAVADMLW